MRLINIIISSNNSLVAVGFLEMMGDLQFFV
jgi:hypothetical protein